MNSGDATAVDFESAGLEVARSATVSNADVGTLNEVCSRLDGVSPFNEQTFRNIDAERNRAVHFTVWASHDSDTLVGYAQLDTKLRTAVLAVHPDFRRSGIATTLVNAVMDQPEYSQEVQWWSFGSLEAATLFAANRGMQASRELLILERPAMLASDSSGEQPSRADQTDLDTPQSTGEQPRVDPPEPTDTPDISAGAEAVDTSDSDHNQAHEKAAQAPRRASESAGETMIRAFDPKDTDDILRINAAAFRDHPEQGSMDATDFAQRTNSTWFEPAGLLVAESHSDGVDQAEIVGFHWAKIDPDAQSAVGNAPLDASQSDSPTAPAGADGLSERIGEVYVLAVDPEHEGHGIGRQLLASGLNWLREQGVTRFRLYVEAEPTRTVDLYRRAGFDEVWRDTAYRLPSR